MAQEILISVIIPCYNCVLTVDETLNSLVHQTFKAFEVVCVNDGSIDGTAEKLEAWKCKNAFDMQIVHQKNGGVSKARNAGICTAKGEYLAFLDADDAYHPEYLERLYCALCKSGADVSYCTLSRDREKVENAVFTQDKWYLEQNQTQAMHNLLYRMADFGFYCYLYRSSILKENSLFFDENTRFFEDREFNWKYLCHCQSAVLIETPMYWYQICEKSATQSKVITWKTEDLEAVKRVEDYLQKCQNPFYAELKSYLFARVIWGKAKRYAIGKRKELFSRLQKEYDVRTCMKRTAKDRNKLVALSSRFYLLSPKLFYFVVGLKK